MSERTPIDQAIAACWHLSDEALSQEGGAAGAYGARMLEKVQRGEIVTAERAALQAIAEQPCKRDKRSNCQTIHATHINRWPDDYCVPCWCRHTLEQQP